MNPLHRHVGRLFILGFPGPTIPSELSAMAREWGLGGVILFSRNIEAPEQVAELAYDVQQLASDVPLWVSVDQEGGRVARLRAPFTEWPAMAALGRHGDPGLSARVATALASELAAVGVTLDFAPVLDLHHAGADPVVGDRALSGDPDQAASLAMSFIEALQAAGVAACGKHFPGHGDTRTDSHNELPVVEHPPDRFRARDLVPFKAAIGADVASVMSAHVLYPAFDDERPATLSRALMSDVLRHEMGHRGLIITDDLEMGAITASHSVSEAAVQAFEAGCDTLLLCGSAIEQHVTAIEALIRAVESGRLSMTALETAWTRHEHVKARFLTLPPRRPLVGAALDARLGTDAHRALAEELARA